MPPDVFIRVAEESGLIVELGDVVLQRAAHDAGYFVSIASLRKLDAASVRSAVERLREQGVDGILAIAPQESAAAGLLQVPPDIPIVAT